MEVHAPQGPVLTFKEALVHLVIVTIGILIALSFEGVVEWSHQRSLVREARANLNQELEDNKREVERVVAKVNSSVIPGLVTTIGALDDVSSEKGIQNVTALFRPGPTVFMVTTGYDRAQLSHASRTTSEVTGAFALMEYTDVKKYAVAYDQQDLYDQMQRQALDRVMAAYGTGLTLDFKKATPADIAAIKQELRLAIGALAAVAEFGGLLKIAYDDALSAED
jgi:hypothetical protein